MTRQNTCPSDDKGFEKYLRMHAREGMPLAVTGLSDNEYALVNQWLREGARTDNALARSARPEEQDTLTVYPWVQGSYPNFAFDVPSEELDRFVAALRLAATPEEFRAVAACWGVRRTRADFWEVFHDFTAYMRETEPWEAGLLDMNRWENF